jgi:hypothetical protein
MTIFPAQKIPFFKTTITNLYLSTYHSIAILLLFFSKLELDPNYFCADYYGPNLIYTNNLIALLETLN